MSQKSELVSVLSLGQQGSTVVITTSAQSGQFIAIQVLTDSVFSAFTGAAMVGYVGPTFPAGTIIYGPITAFTLTSGQVIAYNGTVLA